MNSKRVLNRPRLQCGVVREMNELPETKATFSLQDFMDQ